MSYTIITSFVLQKRDIGNTQKIEDYLKRFEYIKTLNIPTVLFLDRSLSIQETDTLKVIPFNIEDSWIYTAYKDKTPDLPAVRNQDKDTAEYMFIQNSKPEWVFKASQLNPFNTDYFVWVDFGLSHVIKNKDNFNILKNLKLSNDICIGAILTSTHKSFMEKICWRFAGGVFYVNSKGAEIFYETCKSVIEKLVPRLTWEVNIWALIEFSNLLTFNVYYADHNDTILTNLPTLK